MLPDISLEVLCPANQLLIPIDLCVFFPMRCILHLFNGCLTPNLLFCNLCWMRSVLNTFSASVIFSLLVQEIFQV